MGLRNELLELLADGQTHSGTVLAKRLGTSRTAVWKHLQQLRRYGLDVDAIPGKGYRLSCQLEPLAAARIRAALDTTSVAALDSLDVRMVIDSTSLQLRRTGMPPAERWRACLAEYQTGGRGRHGRRWLSRYGSGVCLSIAWQFRHAPAALPALSLAAGVAVIEALEHIGVSGLKVKWPNDVILQDRKLAGILVDVDGEARGPLCVVIGVGVNIEPPTAAGTGMDGGRSPLPPAAVREVLPGPGLSRNQVAAELISSLHAMLVEFGGYGFDRYAERWQRYDYLHGKQVDLLDGPGRRQSGMARGIAADGSLLIASGGEVHRVVSGEISVRVTP